MAIALVTGAGCGIGSRGRAPLAERGDAVTLTARGEGAARAAAAGVVRLATLPDDGPTGGFFRDGRPIAS